MTPTPDDPTVEPSPRAYQYWKAFRRVVSTPENRHALVVIAIVAATVLFAFIAAILNSTRKTDPKPQSTENYNYQGYVPAPGDKPLNHPVPSQPTSSPDPLAAKTSPTSVTSGASQLLSDPSITGLIIADIKNSSIEYQLAYLDSEKLPRDDDVNATRMRYLLNFISQKTGDSPRHIGDRTSGATTVLKDQYGKKVTNQEFLEQAKEYFGSGGPKTNYDDLSTMLIMLMAR